MAGCRPVSMCPGWHAFKALLGNTVGDLLRRTLATVGGNWAFLRKSAERTTEAGLTDATRKWPKLKRG